MKRKAQITPAVRKFLAPIVYLILHPLPFQSTNTALMYLLQDFIEGRAIVFAFLYTPVEISSVV
jgi:hypothetical protein